MEHSLLLLIDIASIVALTQNFCGRNFVKTHHSKSARIKIFDNCYTTLLKFLLPRFCAYMHTVCLTEDDV